MKNNNSTIILGLLICLGLAILGYLIEQGTVRIKASERTVTAKGLSEREVQADVAIWPIKFSDADNDLNNLYSAIQQKTDIITRFLKKSGFSENEVSVSVPAIRDRQADAYGNTTNIAFRYTATSTITVYSNNVELVRKTMGSLVNLGKQGIVISGKDYETKTEFLFTKLNDIKPQMIEEATKNARLVAQKFAQDSKSKLGKVKRARQGQFSIEDRDSNTPYIKKVRVVSTLEYYLSD